jgi:hypothetical protein
MTKPTKRSGKRTGPTLFTRQRRLLALLDALEPGNFAGIG